MKKLQAFSLVSLLVLVTVLTNCSFNTILKQKSNKASIELEFPQLHTGNQRQVNRAVINKTSYLYLFTIEKNTNEAKLYGPYSVSPGKTLTITDIEVAEYSFFCILNTAEKEDGLESRLIKEDGSPNLDAPSESSLMKKFANSNDISSAATAKVLPNKTIIAGTNTISETLIPLVQVENEKIYSATSGSLDSTDSPVFYKITNLSDNEYFSFPSPQQGSTVLLYDANGKKIPITNSINGYMYSQIETPKEGHIFVYLDAGTSISCTFEEDIPNTTGLFLVSAGGSSNAFGTKKPTTIDKALELIRYFDAGPPTGGFEIILQSDITLASTIDLSLDEKITIKSQIGKKSITADSNLNNSLFNITKGEIVFDNIIIGNEGPNKTELNGPAVNVLPGDEDEVSLTLKNTTIQNFKNTATIRYGGGIYIEGNTSNTANLILEEGSLITNCSAGYGGGVIVLDNSIFTMKGGSILNNTAIDWGGGVCVYGTFTMNDGSITQNTADKGGGVYVESGGTLNEIGGSITGNTATFAPAAAGGGLYWQGATINGTGIDVSGNTPDNYYPEP